MHWTSNGQFSVQSAYQLQFDGRITCIFPYIVWECDAPLKCQLIAWLAALNRCLTAGNLLKCAIPCNPVCPLCNAEPETALHLFASCAFLILVWDLVLQKMNIISPVPLADATDLLQCWSAGTAASKRKA
jgi:hypothetical protein